MVRCRRQLSLPKTEGGRTSRGVWECADETQLLAWDGLWSRWPRPAAPSTAAFWAVADQPLEPPRAAPCSRIDQGAVAQGAIAPSTRVEYMGLPSLAGDWENDLSPVLVLPVLNPRVLSLHFLPVLSVWASSAPPACLTTIITDIDTASLHTAHGHTAQRPQRSLLSRFPRLTWPLQLCTRCNERQQEIRPLQAMGRREDGRRGPHRHLRGVPRPGNGDGAASRGYAPGRCPAAFARLCDADNAQAWTRCKRPWASTSSPSRSAQRAPTRRSSFLAATWVPPW